MIDCWFIVRVRVYSWKLKLKWENGGGAGRPTKNNSGALFVTMDSKSFAQQVSSKWYYSILLWGQKAKSRKRRTCVIYAKGTVSTPTAGHSNLIVLTTDYYCTHWVNVMCQITFWTFIHSFIDWLTDSWIDYWFEFEFIIYYWQDNEILKSNQIKSNHQIKYDMIWFDDMIDYDSRL